MKTEFHTLIRLPVALSFTRMLGLDSHAAVNVAFYLASAPESGGPAVLHALRRGDPSVAFTVDYVMTDGTAKAGVDYLAQNANVTFGPLETLSTIAVPILDDTEPEWDEEFNLVLTLGTVRGQTMTLSCLACEGVTQTTSASDSTGNRAPGHIRRSSVRSGVLEGATTTETNRGTIVLRGLEAHAAIAAPWLTRRQHPGSDFHNNGPSSAAGLAQTRATR